MRNPQCRRNLSGADFSEHTKSLSVLSNISYAVLEFFFRVLQHLSNQYNSCQDLARINRICKYIKIAGVELMQFCLVFSLREEVSSYRDFFYVIRSIGGHGFF